MKSLVNKYEDNILALKQKGIEEVNRLLQEKLKLQAQILQNMHEQSKIKKYMEQL